MGKGHQRRKGNKPRGAAAAAVTDLPDAPLDEDALDSGPSKSAVKREMTARQELGEALCALSPKERAEMPIEDERLVLAIEEASRIKSNSALRRHRQYIGKLMRQIDPEPLQKALDELYATKRQDTEAFHALEGLRERLCLEGDAAISEVLDHYANVDRQHLRQLVRDAQREHKLHSEGSAQNAGHASAATPRKASRRLFRYLRDLQEGSA